MFCANYAVMLTPRRKGMQASFRAQYGRIACRGSSPTVKEGSLAMIEPSLTVGLPQAASYFEG